MKKLLILALTSAFVAVANAAGDWFRVSVAVGGSTQTTTGASWSTTPAVADGVISIDEDVDTALSLTPNAQSPDAQTNTVVTVEATFTAVSDAGSLESPGTDAKTALTVAKDGDNDYYYYWNGQWNQISREIAIPTSNKVTVRIELDNTSMTGTTATIKVDDGTTVATVANISTQTKTKVSGLAFAGTGKIGNINADYTKADASYNGIYYATVGGAIAAKGGNSGDITVYAHDNVYPANIIKGANDVLLFPRTKTADQDGSTDHPYEIADADDLIALKDAVASVDDARSLSYTQTVDIVLNEAWPGIGIQNGKDIVSDTAFDNGAFTGTYDGGNHTISGFQMVGVAGNPANEDKEQSKWEGLDYCGFFNSTYGATIKNLKIQYAGSLFATDTTASTKESGATFVGVAKSSTLQNLTSVAGTVSCSKGFGGIVGYLMGGSVVDSCTNNVNLTSLAPNKCGGIAMITQNGSGNAFIRNCQNNGTTAGDANQKGGIVGYVGVATTIDGCSDTAGSGPSILHNHGQTVTISGVITAPTNVVAYTTSNNNPINGLDFATVDANGIATFVKAADLAAGNTYKVMGPKAAATYQFTAAGTIAFDTALATPTYAITTASGLKLENENPTPVANVTTYTASELATPTVTVTGGANATAAWTVNGEPVASAPATLTEGDTYSVTYTANSGYEFAAGAKTSESGTAGTENIVITIDNATEVTQIEVVSTAETTLVAVPANCNAAGLISTDNRDTGDILKVYSKGDKCYYTWTLTGAKGTWDPLQTWVINGEAAATSHSKPASEVELSAGQAAWLTRTSAASKNAKIILAVVAAGNTIPATVQKGYNLVAPPPKAGASTITIDEVVADDATGKDKVFIPAEGKAPYNLDFKDGHWGYDKYTIENGQLKKVRITDVTIPAGTGFFYINNGDAAKSVTLGSED